MTETNTPLDNLDNGYDADGLWALWEQHHRAPRRTAAAWFPDRPEGYVSAAHDIAAYCCNKSVAMKTRARGDVAAAQVYERICDRIYNELPCFARLW